MVCRFEILDLQVLVECLNKKGSWVFETQFLIYMVIQGSWR